MTDIPPNEVSSPGGRLAGRMAKVVADATIYTRQRMTPHQNNLIQKALADFTGHVSDEIRGIMAPLWEELAGNENTPAEFRSLFESLSRERGQAFGWIAGSLASSAITPSVVDLFSMLLAPSVQGLISKVPHKLLAPEQAASAAQRLLVSDEFARAQALFGGLSEDKLDVLKRLSALRLPPEAILDLFRRGTYTQDYAHRQLRHLGMPTDIASEFLSLSRVRLSPEQLAAMWNRSIVDTGEGRREAALSGVSQKDFDRLTELGGEPLGPESLGEAYRRGFIDRARFNRGIVQGPIRNEWFDVLERLQYRRMSVADAADAVNQGHMSESDGRSVAKANGLDSDDFSTLLETAGQPPGIEFAADAYNRGLINDRDYDVMFLESRIKNRYLPLLRSMRTRLIPQETVRLLYRYGVYSREATLATLLKHGFTPEDAEALLSVEDRRGDDNTRELTRSQIIDMYEEQLLSKAETITMLSSLGYSPEVSQAQVDLADLRRIRRFINSAVNRLRSAYTAGRMTETSVYAQLDALGVPSDQRDQLVRLWDIDRTTISKTLTASQIRQAVSKDLISQEEAIARLKAQGYDESDAALYLRLTS